MIDDDDPLHDLTPPPASTVVVGCESNSSVYEHSNKTFMLTRPIATTDPTAEHKPLPDPPPDPPNDPIEPKPA